MRVFSNAFHTSYQYSLATAFPEIQWYFVNGVWSDNRPCPVNIHHNADRDFEKYDVYLAHSPGNYFEFRDRLKGHGVSQRKVVYISHWSYNPEAWIHQAQKMPLTEFAHEVSESPIVAVSHFMVQQFGFYSHVACEAIPHFVPSYLFSDTQWVGDRGNYINIVNNFFDNLRGAGADFWRSTPDIPKSLYGTQNGDESLGPLKTLDEFKRVVAHAKGYLWTGEKVAMSYAPLEAMACGCPVIAPDNMDWSKLFTDESDVLLYKEGDMESLKQTLSKYEASESLRHTLSSNGRKTIEMRFGLPQFRAKWQRVLDGALADW